MRDWLATIPMVLLVPALILASGTVDANQPRLHAPERAEAGAQITVSGTGFPRRTTVQLLWSGSASGMPQATTDARGAVAAVVFVPAATEGSYEISAAHVKSGAGGQTKPGGRARELGRVLATTSIHVEAPAEAVEATPTAAPPDESVPAPTERTASPTASASPSPTPVASPSATASPVATPKVTAAPTTSPSPTPTPAPAPRQPTPAGAGIWISQAELMQLPTSGAPWQRLVQTAGAPIPVEALSCQDATASRATMATALVAARTNDNRLRGKVRDELLRIMGSEDGGTCGHQERNRPLAVGRNLTAYVIAADVIGFGAFDPAGEQTWRNWLSALRSKPLVGGWALDSAMGRADHSNWGAHEAAALTAANLYLGDSGAVALDAAWARAWVDPRAPMRWTYRTDKHDYSWSSTGIPPTVPVNPKGASKNGIAVDGIPLVDMQRGAGFTSGQPTLTDYPRESLVGRTVQAELLHRAGYPAFEWGDRGLLRVARRLLAFSQQWDSDWYEPRMNAYWILERRLGAGLPRAESAVGRQVVGTDWTHR